MGLAIASAPMPRTRSSPLEACRQSDVARASPERGELVQVRSRRWLVEDIVPAEISGQSPIVQLSCADDAAQSAAPERVLRSALRQEDRRAILWPSWRIRTCAGDVRSGHSLVGGVGVVLALKRRRTPTPLSRLLALHPRATQPGSDFRGSATEAYASREQGRPRKRS